MPNLLNLNGGRVEFAEVQLVEGESWVFPEVITPESVPSGNHQRIYSRGSSDYLMLTTAMKLRWDYGEAYVDSTETLDLSTSYDFTIHFGAVNLTLTVTKNSDDSVVSVISVPKPTVGPRAITIGSRNNGSDAFLGKLAGTIQLGSDRAYSMDQITGTTTISDEIGDDSDATLTGLAAFEPDGGAALPDIVFDGFHDNAFAKITNLANNESVFSVSGTINNGATVSEIEWRRGDGAWQSLIVSPSNTFASPGITLTGRDSISFRSTDEPATEYTFNNVGVAYVLGMLGQSNGAGRGDNNQLVTLLDKFAYMLDGQDLPVAFSDPYSTPSDSDATGSYVAHLMTKIIAEGYNAAVVPGSKGAQSLAALSKGGQLYTDFTRRINSTINGVNGIIYDQGNADVDGDLSNRFTSLNQLVNDNYNDFGADTYIVDVNITTTGGLQLRQINADVIAANEHAHYAGDMLNAMPANQVHLTTDQELQDAATEIYQYLPTVVTSTFNLANTNVPDGIYQADLINLDTKSFAGYDVDVTFNNGNASITMNVPAGAKVLLFEEPTDINNQGADGIAYIGVTE